MLQMTWESFTTLPPSEYPSKQVVWTRYQGWYPVTRVKCEAFVVAPWEINNGENDAQILKGMKNAYCIVAKWNNEVTHPTRAFQRLGNAQNSIPGCLHLIDFDCVTQRNWSFRSTVAVKFADLLSKPSLTTHTQDKICIDGVAKGLWDNFKNWIIPLEQTEREVILTKRTIRKNLVIEMLKDTTIKHFARFDTLARLEMLKDYFGSGIQGAGRIRRFAGPHFSRQTGPAPAFNCRRLQSSESVGALIRLPEAPTAQYRSNQPGVDVIYIPAKRQFTIRVRYVVERLSDPVVQEQLLGLHPPLPAPNNAVNAAVVLVPNTTEFQHQGTLFMVRDFTVDGDEVICEVLETKNDDYSDGDVVNLPIQLVKQAVEDYSNLDE